MSSVVDCRLTIDTETVLGFRLQGSGFRVEDVGLRPSYRIRGLSYDLYSKKCDGNFYSRGAIF